MTDETKATYWEYDPLLGIEYEVPARLRDPRRVIETVGEDGVVTFSYDRQTDDRD